MRTGSVLNVHCDRRFVNKHVAKDREVMRGRNATFVTNTKRGKQYDIREVMSRRNATSVINTKRGKQYNIDLSVHYACDEMKI